MVNKKFGFRSKAILDRRGFFSGMFIVTSTNGSTGKVEGRSKERNVKDNSKQMLEDARLHAVSQFLYKNGYYVEASNYEELDIDKIKSVKLSSYNFYYTENEFQSYSSIKKEYKKKGKVSYVVQRDKRGRFVKFYPDNSRDSSKNIKKTIDVKYEKKQFASKYK